MHRLQSNFTPNVEGHLEAFPKAHVVEQLKSNQCRCCDGESIQKSYTTNDWLINHRTRRGLSWHPTMSELATTVALALSDLSAEWSTDIGKGTNAVDGEILVARAGRANLASEISALQSPNGTRHVEQISIDSDLDANSQWRCNQGVGPLGKVWPERDEGALPRGALSRVGRSIMSTQGL